MCIDFGRHGEVDLRGDPVLLQQAAQPLETALRGLQMASHRPEFFAH